MKYRIELQPASAPQTRSQWFDPTSAPREDGRGDCHMRVVRRALRAVRQRHSNAQEGSIQSSDRFSGECSGFESGSISPIE